jgi:hypothetical protein
MGDTFQRLYGATAFDPNDRQDQLGEAARLLILDAALPVLARVQSGKDMPHLLGGLLVGIVQITQAVARPGGMTADEIDASIRASIIQIAPWAVDMARSAEGKEPLVNA